MRSLLVKTLLLKYFFFNIRSILKSNSDISKKEVRMVNEIPDLRSQVPILRLSQLYSHFLNPLIKYKLEGMLKLISLL